MIQKILGILLCITSFLLYAEEGPKSNIVYLTIPKGGSHLFRKAIGLITERPIRVLLDKSPPYFPDPYIRSHHLEPGYDYILNDVSGLFTKAIMIRDPRDVIVSMAAWIEVMANTKAAQEFIKRPLDEQITELICHPDLSMNGNYTFVFDTKLTVDCALEWMKNPTVFVCRFEDLVGQEGGGSRKKQLETIEALAKHLGYDFPLKKIHEIADNLFGDTATFRLGQIGSWRNVFSPLHKELFKRVLGNELIKLGYEQDDNW